MINFNISAIEKKLHMMRYHENDNLRRNIMETYDQNYMPYIKYMNLPPLQPVSCDITTLPTPSIVPSKSSATNPNKYNIEDVHFGKLRSLSPSNLDSDNNYNVNGSSNGNDRNYPYCSQNKLSINTSWQPSSHNVMASREGNYSPCFSSYFPTSSNPVSKICDTPLKNTHSDDRLKEGQGCYSKTMSLQCSRNEFPSKYRRNSTPNYSESQGICALPLWQRNDIKDASSFHMKKSHECDTFQPSQSSQLFSKRNRATHYTSLPKSQKDIFNTSNVSKNFFNYACKDGHNRPEIVETVPQQYVIRSSQPKLIEGDSTLHSSDNDHNFELQNKSNINLVLLPTNFSCQPILSSISYPPSNISEENDVTKKKESISALLHEPHYIIQNLPLTTDNPSTPIDVTFPCFDPLPIDNVHMSPELVSARSVSNVLSGDASSECGGVQQNIAVSAIFNGNDCKSVSSGKTTPSFKSETKLTYKSCSSFTDSSFSEDSSQSLSYSRKFFRNGEEFALAHNDNFGVNPTRISEEPSTSLGEPPMLIKIHSDYSEDDDDDDDDDDDYTSDEDNFADELELLQKKQPDTTPMTAEGILSLIKKPILKPHEPDTKDLNSFLVPHEVGHINHLIKCYSDAVFTITMPASVLEAKAISPMNYMDIHVCGFLQVCSLMLKCEDFLTLIVSDQMAILESSMLPVLVSLGIPLYNHDAKSWVIPSLLENMYPLTLYLSDFLQILPKPVVDKISVLQESIKELDIDWTMSMLLVSIFIYTPTNKEIVEMEIIDKIRDKYIKILLNYIKWKYGIRNAALLFPEVLKLMDAILKLCQETESFQLRFSEAEIKVLEKRMTFLNSKESFSISCENGTKKVLQSQKTDYFVDGLSYSSLHSKLSIVMENLRNSIEDLPPNFKSKQNLENKLLNFVQNKFVQACPSSS